MYTIVDYLKYYKDSNFDEVGFNVMDNLLFSILVYLPIESFDKVKSFDEFCNYSMQYKDIKTNSSLAHIAFDLLKEINGSKRYKSITVSSFVNYRDNNTQFGASKFKIGDKTIIAYKGTDHSSIGWYENFRLLYLFPTYTQSVAYDYLKKNILKSDKNIYLCGHSKGGNLSISSALLCDKTLLKKIVKIYNFDGPGVLSKEFNSERFNIISEKLVNIIPTGSVIGAFLYNQGYDVVESVSSLFNEHYPNSWCIFGTKFVHGKLSKVSQKLHVSTTKGVSELNQNDIRDAIESIINVLGKEGKSDFDFSFNDVKEIIKNMKGIDKNVSRLLITILSNMLNLGN